MQIVIIRHGEAVADAPGGDASRFLTGRGRKRTRRVAAWLARNKRRRPVEIWVSPLGRAVQTAEIVAEHAGITDRVNVVAELSPGRDPREICDLIAKRDPNDGPVALVGHEPSLSLIAGALLGEASFPALKKSGVVLIARDPDGKTSFNASLDPKGLKIEREIQRPPVDASA
jgi:phosphohistidine phosphatase